MGTRCDYVGVCRGAQSNHQLIVGKECITRRGRLCKERIRHDIFATVDQAREIRRDGARIVVRVKLLMDQGYDSEFREDSLVAAK